MSIPDSAKQDRPGRFGPFGGQYVAETLMAALHELEAAWEAAQNDPAFWAEYHRILAEYVGRPSPLWRAERLAKALSICTSAKIFLKREDLNHTGAHKINNCVGQALLAKRMGKTRILAETGAGQHGVATATVAALLGMQCDVFMGAVDVERQAPNVFRMRLLGATVHPVAAGSATLKDAMNEALRAWVTHVRDAYYLIGSVAGPHPYPTLVRDLQAVIGNEAREQILQAEGRLPSRLIACVGGGSNALGLWHAFRNDPSRLIGVEAAGDGVDTDRHAATLSRGRVGVLHGAKSYLLSDPAGNISEAHSISAGLDYPGVGPEHAWLKESGRAEYFAVTDDEALAGFDLLAKTEGILPALESSHAIAYLARIAAEIANDELIVISLSGRGDKDLAQIARRKGISL